mmetsp:Transcript_4258/g.7549  ORF Transcript_4258/g.7549 Transcript_4258/m.7549 type:complete len:218 (+) Transcript_4258:80-733(+)
MMASRKKRQASGSSSGKTKKKKNTSEDELSIAWAAVHSAMAAQLPAVLLEKAHETEVKADESSNFGFLWDVPNVGSEEQKLNLVKLAESIHDIKFGEWGSIHLNSMFTATYVYSCKFMREEGQEAIEIRFDFQLTHDGGLVRISHKGKEWCMWSSYDEGLTMSRNLKKKDLKVQDQLLGSGQEKITLEQLIGLMCNLDVMKDVRLARPAEGAGPCSL